MSSILKALKKLEDDKASRRPDELKIDREILRTDNFSRFSTTGILFTSLLLLAGGSGVTYMYMKRDKPPELMSQKSTATYRQNKPSVTSAPDIRTEQLPEAVVVVPVSQRKTAKPETPKPETSKLNQASTPAMSAPAVAAQKSSRPAVASKPVEQEKASSLPHTIPPSASIKTVPALRVNGIAFQDGDVESVAMINGVPVSNGGVIEGVKIEEIHKNRVKFSYNGEKFEIPLGQSNRQ